VVWAVHAGGALQIHTPAARPLLRAAASRIPGATSRHCARLPFPPLFRLASFPSISRHLLLVHAHKTAAQHFPAAACWATFTAMPAPFHLNMLMAPTFEFIQAALHLSWAHFLDRSVFLFFARKASPVALYRAPSPLPVLGSSERLTGQQAMDGQAGV